ncbi:MAG: hypothetical protein OEU54_09145 [Gemmatimonadota bacterium]|nr:hypothetical protein [Gemmatimonadota bacterium]
MKKGVLLTALAIAGLLTVPTRADAQVAFGPEAMFGTEFDFGLGGRLVAGLGTEIPLEFQGGFNIFFPDGPRDYWELNGNVWFTIDTPAIGAPYVGGGLNIGRRTSSESVSSTELALNIGGGYRFNFTNTAPFIEARFALGGHEQFVIGGGFLFGGF